MKSNSCTNIFSLQVVLVFVFQVILVYIQITSPQKKTCKTYQGGSPKNHQRRLPTGENDNFDSSLGGFINGMDLDTTIHFNILSRHTMSRVIYPGLPRTWDPLMVSFPYHSHIFRDSYWSGMGIVWGPRGPMSLGVPENLTDHRYFDPQPRKTEKKLAPI